MPFWFNEKFSWRQRDLGDVVLNANGVCTILVAAWLKQKESDTSSGAAKAMLARMKGGDWASIKNGIIDGGEIGGEWRNLAAQQFDAPYHDMAPVNLVGHNALQSQLFFPVAEKAALYKFNYIHLGPVFGISHAIGVFRDSCSFRKYHMFDPNFGECRATHKTGVQKWIAWLYQKTNDLGQRKYKDLKQVNVRSWG